MRHDPVGDDRAPGRAANDAERMTGLAIVGAAALAFVVCVATFALGHAGSESEQGDDSGKHTGAGLAWLAMNRRRIRQEERDRVSSHPAR